MSAPYVARLQIFPFKSLDGIDVEAAALTQRGGFQLDRAYAFVDPKGGYINGKTEPRIHALRMRCDAARRRATFEHPHAAQSYTFALDSDSGELAAWVAGVLGRPVRVCRDDDGGFPDDGRAPGPTIVSTATLATVAAWFDGLAVDSLRRRLRTNIEVDGVPPFWEDSLYGGAAQALPFRVGDVVFEATNPCQRCVVPSRDPDTGVPLPAFAKRIAERRAATLPPWVERSRFDHYYRLAVNTRAPAGQAGRIVRVGQTLTAPVLSGV